MTNPQKLFDYNCITLYIHYIFHGSIFHIQRNLNWIYGKVKKNSILFCHVSILHINEFKKTGTDIMMINFVILKYNTYVIALYIQIYYVKYLFWEIFNKVAK